MKPRFWLTIYMYKQHIKNQPKSNIWNTLKFEEQIYRPTLFLCWTECEHTYIFKFILKTSHMYGIIYLQNRMIDFSSLARFTRLVKSTDLSRFLSLGY